MIKRKKQEQEKEKEKDIYYHVDELITYEAMYNVIYGGRNNGKSYSVKEWMAEQAYFNGKKFGLIFRRESSKLVRELESYFGDVDIKGITGGTYDGILVRAGEVWFTLGGKKLLLIGYTFFIDREQNYKSLTFPDTYHLMFEEFITEVSKRKADPYLPDEAVKLDSLCSTVFRNRKDCKVFLIGNTTTYVTPYVTEWGLTRMGDKQQLGTIDVYTRNYTDSTGKEHEIKIAVERTASGECEQNFAITNRGQKVARGEWETDNCLQIEDEERVKCDELYAFVITYSGFYFLLKFYRHYRTNDYFLYCTKKTSPIQPGTRVVGDIDSIDVMFTKGFQPLVERERYVFSLIKQDKIFYATPLIAQSFRVAVASLGL